MPLEREIPDQSRDCAPCKDNDEALMRRLVAGDLAALDALLGRHWSPLVAYSRGFLGDADAADDVAQSTFVDLWHKRTDWTSGGSVRAYLYRVARSRSLNRLRHRRVLSRAASELERIHVEERQQATPLETLESAERRRALENAIDQLPERRREVLVLGYMHGLPHREIAEVMGITVRTVKNQMSAALAALREAVRSRLR